MNNKLSASFLLIIWCIFSAACWSSDPKTERKTGSIATPGSTVSSDNKNSSVSKTDPPSANKMSDNEKIEVKSGGYTGNLPSGFVQPTDAVGQKILKEYGALFIARGGATPPKTVVFKSEAEVSAFQNGLQKSKENIGGFDVELQAAAMKGLQDAIAEAKQNSLKITPRGADSARRDYAATVELWASRVNPAFVNYVGKGKIPQSEADRIKALPPYEQVPEIWKFEAQGMYFDKFLSKPIMYSVAPPGTSQHLSMLALDVSEFKDVKVREILAKHGWFQTVVSDLPHFTFLGVPESQLTDLGLKKVSDSGQVFYVPNL